MDVGASREWGTSERIDAAVTRISIDVEIARKRRDVWEEIRRIDRHVLWMSDAQRIDFRSPQREGVGTSFVCVTKIGPFTTRDVMTVTRWDEQTAIGVFHQGLFSGRGEFLLTDVGSATRMTWRENLAFPWWCGGPFGASVARPVLVIIWRKNLSHLARLLDSDRSNEK